jgi:mRNA interferase YafQ
LKPIVQHRQFKSDLKRIGRSGLHRPEELLKVVNLLVSATPLEPKHRDHALTGNWVGFRECHIKPDWLLIYQITPSALNLVRTGSHSELF